MKPNFAFHCARFDLKSKSHFYQFFSMISSVKLESVIWMFEVNSTDKNIILRKIILFLSVFASPTKNELKMHSSGSIL